MAIAFAMTGVPIMSITFPLLYELVYNNYGLFGGILIISGLQSELDKTIVFHSFDFGKLWKFCKFHKTLK